MQAGLRDVTSRKRRMLLRLEVKSNQARVARLCFDISTFGHLLLSLILLDAVHNRLISILFLLARTSNRHLVQSSHCTPEDKIDARVYSCKNNRRAKPSSRQTILSHYASVQKTADRPCEEITMGRSVSFESFIGPYSIETELCAVLLKRR